MAKIIQPRLRRGLGGSGGEMTGGGVYAGGVPGESKELSITGENYRETHEWASGE